MDVGQAALRQYAGTLIRSHLKPDAVSPATRETGSYVMEMQSTGSGVIRILLADHNVQSLWALRTMLDEQEGVEVVGLAERGEELVELAVTRPVDVILVDRMLPGPSLAELMASLHAVQPSSFVIVVGANTEYGRSALHAGADAFVSKSDDPEWLLERVRSYARRLRK